VTIFDVLKHTVAVYADKELNILVTFDGNLAFTIWTGDLDDSGWVEAETWMTAGCAALDTKQLRHYALLAVQERFSAIAEREEHEDRQTAT